jgi:chemotaxis protein methyltransferase CheR
MPDPPRAYQAGADPEPLSAGEFESIRRMALEKFGLDLRNGKEQLVSARLGKPMREGNFRSFRDYCRHVLEDRSGEALTAMIDALTTNHTSFLREPAHFDFLRVEVLPALASRPSFRLWSAACATGEEPYTLALCALEALGERRPDVRVLATDISTRALRTAEAGVYAAERLEGLQPALLRRYFLRGEGRWYGCYRLKPEVRRIVEFRRMNLIEPFSPGPLPVIFCRNVMIYFNRDTRQGLVRRLEQSLEPGGYLFVGHAESLTGLDHDLQYVCPAVYRKPQERNR